MKSLPIQFRAHLREGVFISAIKVNGLKRSVEGIAIIKDGELNWLESPTDLSSILWVLHDPTEHNVISHCDVVIPVLPTAGLSWFAFWWAEWLINRDLKRHGYSLPMYAKHNDANYFHTFLDVRKLRLTNIIYTAVCMDIVFQPTKDFQETFDAFFETYPFLRNLKTKTEKKFDLDTLDGYLKEITEQKVYKFNINNLVGKK